MMRRPSNSSKMTPGCLGAGATAGGSALGGDGLLGVEGVVQSGFGRVKR